MGLLRGATAVPAAAFALALWAVSPAAGATLHLSPRGSDSASGSAAAPLRTLGEAWGRIPEGRSGSWTILLAPGDYRRGAPQYWENRSGQITIAGSAAARLGPMNVYRVRGLALRGVPLSGGGDVFHCERCRSVTLDRVTVRAGESQEAVKFNQSSAMTVRRSDIRGGQDNAFDAVAVRGLRLLDNRIGGSQDWCAYAKGGSSEVIVRGNLFSGCGTGGFSAGQGTGFQWMSPPYLHHEARGVLVEGNTVRDVEGAAIGVQGGYNVLVRDNLAENVGRRSHVLEALYGGRSCDGRPGDEGRERCSRYLRSGGWGTTRVDDGENFVRIPNRRVFFYNNVILNRRASRWQVLEVPGPPPARWQRASNVP
ncbi:MAG: right-handed parallel beta-helix repeat-containing protein, partial [Verrucomicrobiota bacterium]